MRTWITSQCLPLCHSITIFLWSFWTFGILCAETNSTALPLCAKQQYWKLFLRIYCAFFWREQKFRQSVVFSLLIQTTRQTLRSFLRSLIIGAHTESWLAQKAGPSSKYPAQDCATPGSVVHWLFLVDTRPEFDVHLMLVHRRRRWTNIKWAPGSHLAFAGEIATAVGLQWQTNIVESWVWGIWNIGSALGQCGATLGRAFKSPTWIFCQWLADITVIGESGVYDDRIAGPTLTQRRRRWHNIRPALGQCIAPAGNLTPDRACWG